MRLTRHVNSFKYTHTLGFIESHEDNNDKRALECFYQSLSLLFQTLNPLSLCVAPLKRKLSLALPIGGRSHGLMEVRLCSFYVLGCNVPYMLFTSDVDGIKSWLKFKDGFIIGKPNT